MAVENLEQRLPLSGASAGGSASEPNGAPNGAPAAIAPSPFGEGLPFGAGPAAGVETTAPGTTGIATTGVGTIATGALSDQRELAFNNPSWIPQDRPPMPGTTPSDQLPFNPYQVAKTPFGVRNFTIGPNTSMAHDTGAVQPRTLRQALAETDAQTASLPLGEDLADEWVLSPIAAARADERAAEAPSDSSAAEPLPARPHFDETAVDRLMTEGTASEETMTLGDRLTAGSGEELAAERASRQVAVENADVAPPDASEIAHAAVATGALAVGLTPWRQPVRDYWAVDKNRAAPPRRRVERLAR